MIAVELVGGPLDGPRCVTKDGPTLGLLDSFDRHAVYVRDSSSDELRIMPRYVYRPPSGGFRGQCSCACGKAGCPNYGVDV